MKKIPLVAFALVSFVLLSGMAGAEEINSAIIASEENYPDALMAGVAANKIGAPLLFTRRGQTPEETLEELESMNITTIYIIGGPHAVSEDVENELAETYDVVRLWGMTRYGTSAAVAEYFWDDSVEAVLVWDLLGTPGPGSNSEMVAKARDLAQSTGAPLLLMPKNALPEVTMNAMKKLGVEDVTTVGSMGTNVDDSLEEEWINITEKIQGNAAQVAARVREKVKSIIGGKRPLVIVAVGNWSDLLKAPYKPNGTSRHISSEDQIDGLITEINEQNYSRIIIVGKPVLSSTIYDRLIEAGIDATLVSGGPAKTAAMIMKMEGQIIKNMLKIHTETRNIVKLQNRAQTVKNQAEGIISALNNTIKTLQQAQVRLNATGLLDAAVRLKNRIQNNIQAGNYEDALKNYKMLENKHEQLKLRNTEKLSALISSAISREKVKSAVKISSQTGQ